jgi:hypothetical protein
MCCRTTRVVMGLFVGALAMVLMAQPAQAEIEFGIPTPMPVPFDVGGGYGYPWLSADELDIYFTSDRAGPNSSDPYSEGAFDVWKSHRNSTTDPWQTFVNLGAPINTSELAEAPGSFSADGEEFYFWRALSGFGLAEADLFVSRL